MTTKFDDGGPAYPSQHSVSNHDHEYGISFLDLAAMHAMQGLLAGPDDYDGASWPVLASMAYDGASALLAEKRKREAQP